MSNQNTTAPVRPNDIVVLKLGSSILRDESSFPEAVHEIYRHVRTGKRVIAVVSAVGDTTDQLIHQARRIAEESTGPDHEGYAALLSTGEATSVALLRIGLGRAGIPAAAVDASRIGLRTHGPLLEAELEAIDIDAIHEIFRSHAVIVIPGFVGRDDLGRTTLLGRGGSDMTALFLSQQLNASRCILLKDVDGIYSEDPKRNVKGAQCFKSLHYSDAQRCGTQVVQAKALRFAADFDINFEVASLNSQAGTKVSASTTSVSAPRPARPPLRVALLGLGTVGLGLYRRLAAMPDKFEVVGIAVRDLNRVREPEVPSSLLSDKAAAVAKLDSDVLVELIGGTDPTIELIRASLSAGRPVITANKAIIASHGEELRQLAIANGTTISYSAAVGGSVPLIELLSAVEPQDIVAIEGVLNGTSNYILDRLAKGQDFAATVKEAQIAGFAEADPTLDLDGVDAAQKLSILIAHGYQQAFSLQQISCRGINPDDGPRAYTAQREHHAVRLVASCRRKSGTLTASVGPLRLPSCHPLAQLRDEQNGLVVYLRNGEHMILTGKGAGRWPTTESVFADLNELRLTDDRSTQIKNHAIARDGVYS